MKRQSRGPYTLPLPPLPRRPAWRDGRGDPKTSGLARRLAKVKHISQEKTWEMPDTVLDCGSYTRPIRSGGAQYWDADKGRWMACPDRRTIRRYLKSLASA